MSMMQGVLYFAYGSNMPTSRIQDRVIQAKTVGIAMLNGYKMVCNKKSKDGSGKGNLIKMDDAQTWGVLYEMSIDDLAELAKYERGYDQVEVEVYQDGKPVRVVTFISNYLTSEPPFETYKDLIVEGAIDHGLPEAYIDYLRSMPSRSERKVE